MRRALMLPWLAALLGLCVARASPALAGTGARPVPVPSAGRAVSVAHANHIVGRGTAASCTSAAVVAAVRAGGVIRFACGSGP